MKKIIKLTEQDLTNIVERVLLEQKVSSLIQGNDDLCLVKCKIKIAANGSNGKGVQEIQNGLASLGFYKGEGGGMNPDCAKNPQSCDGKFRKRTKQAVEEFQGSTDGKACGLIVDGIVGSKTLECLDKKLQKNRQCDCEKVKKDEENKDIGGQDLVGGKCKNNVSKYLGVNLDNLTIDNVYCCLTEHLFKTAPDYTGFENCLKKNVKQTKTINKTDCPKYIDCTKEEDKKFCSPEIRKICTQYGSSYTQTK